ncbi:hypothetical protein [Kushneria marisflavi]|uniref:hypothetical protein n=1 Tax=Kushneria marisflavi TaxID=157779 RepID=UPI000FED589F|nr:hypothetical protein [Kushneria marisflavi]RKD86690.1 hypothetical protein C8D96_0138 [Kushneria marisflavi]
MPPKDHEEPVIGADRNAAYSTRTESRSSGAHRGPRRPTLWPLYLLVLLLAAAVTAMGVQYYQDRQRWSERVTALTDKAEEVAANRQEMSTNLDHILDGVRSEQQSQRMQLETLQQRLERQASDDKQKGRLDQLEKADALRQQTFASLQQSLDSLDAVIEGLKSTYDARFKDVDNTNAEQSDRLQIMEGNLQQLKTLADSVSEQEKTLSSIKARVDELATQTERLQQSQTSLHAAQESIQDLLNP